MRKTLWLQIACIAGGLLLFIGTFLDVSKGFADDSVLIPVSSISIPQIPVVYVFTETGKDPTYEEINAPQDMWGGGITNNEYVKCRIEYVEPSGKNINQSGEIKIRGNTSSRGNKKSYKIKLQTPLDFFNRGERHSEKNWLLLNNGTSLNNLIGTWLSEYLGMEYVPQMQLVNVVVNDDWRGMYYLSEPVERGEERINIGDDGLIIENDAYWWNEDYYYRPEGQIQQMAFTLKYPKTKKLKDQEKKEIEEYISKVFSLIMNSDPDVEKYIEAESFAAYLIVRDIMRTGDGGGSNMYYSVNSLSDESSKLRMGPVWDFDAAMKGSEGWFSNAVGNEGWSFNHSQRLTFFPQLLEISFFKNAVQGKWNEVKDKLYDEFHAWINEYYSENHSAIDESRSLDGQRWEKEISSLDEEVKYDDAFIRDRMLWIDSNLMDNP